jgi:hypothetical protein
MSLFTPRTVYWSGLEALDLEVAAWREFISLEISYCTTGCTWITGSSVDNETQRNNGGSMALGKFGSPPDHYTVS